MSPKEVRCFTIHEQSDFLLIWRKTEWKKYKFEYLFMLLSDDDESSYDACGMFQQELYIVGSWNSSSVISLLQLFLMLYLENQTYRHHHLFICGVSLLGIVKCSALVTKVRSFEYGLSRRGNNLHLFNKVIPLAIISVKIMPQWKSNLFLR